MNIAVLMGGHISEHAVSLNSGETVTKALSAHKPLKVVIDSDLYTWHIESQALPAHEALSFLAEKVEVIVPVLHGPFGEDGTLQGLLEGAHIPFIGSGVHASAAAMNKNVSNLLFQQAGLQVPKFIAFTRQTLMNQRSNIEAIGFPLVVKPQNAGSSVGITFVNSWREVIDTIDESEFNSFIAQEKIQGREISCGVIERNGTPAAVPSTEIIPNNTFFDYEAKYTPGASEEITPADLTKEVGSAIQEASIQAHMALGCSGITRSDFILDQNNSPYILELNTAPGMTSTSLVPQQIEANGENLHDVLYDLCKERLNT